MCLFVGVFFEKTVLLLFVVVCCFSFIIAPIVCWGLIVVVFVLLLVLYVLLIVLPIVDVCGCGLSPLLSMFF